MGPSKQVSRRTGKKDLAKRLNSVASEGLESHDEQVLWEACPIRYPCHLDFLTVTQYGLDEETRGIKTIKDTVRTASQEWVWEPVPQVSGMKPWLAFLYRGKFCFEDGVQIEKSLEVYDCPVGCSKICLTDAGRVLFIYK
jgi:hypothetical protein